MGLSEDAEPLASAVGLGPPIMFQVGPLRVNPDRLLDLQDVYVGGCCYRGEGTLFFKGYGGDGNLFFLKAI